MLEREREPYRQTLVALFAFLAVLLSCSIVNGYVLFSSHATASVFKYVRRDILTVLILTLPILVPGFISTCYGILIYMAALVFTLANVIHFYLYEMPISPYVLHVLNETYLTESLEFIQQYFDAAIVLIILCGIALTLSLFMLFLKNKKRNWKLSILIALIFISFFGIAVFKDGFEKVLRWNYYIHFIYLSKEISYEKELLKKYIASEKNIPKDIACNASENQLLVVVIGESSNRNHYSLYGYPRKTTPHLDKMAKELLIFNDVISPHAHTSASLSKIMTFRSHTEKDPRCTVVDVFNEAGFSTVLLSNQAYLGIFETATSALFVACKTKYYSNIQSTSSYQSAYYDDVLLEQFEKQLSQKGKRVVFLHLLGNHGKYEARYPHDFSYFHDAPPYGKAEQFSTINHYDNSIRFTDFILSQIISKLKMLNRPSAMIYFSDHGEAMYEDGHTAGHAETAKSRFMFEVPFIVYLSPAYREQRPDFAGELSKYTNRPWQTDNLNYSLFTLAGITFKDFRSERDIFSPDFVPTKRFLAKDDYDVLFPEPFVFQ